MLITKILTTTVDLFNDEDIYNPNVEDMLRKKLTDAYQHTCYMSMLVLTIDKIIEHSDRRMADDSLEANAYIDVRFQVSGVVLEKGEILQGCKVVQINTAHIIINHEYASGTLHADEKNILITTVKTGMTLPVIIDNVSYSPGKNKITIYAQPFMPIIHEQKLYYIISGMTKEEEKKFTLLIDEYTRLLDYFKSFKNTAQLKVFKEIMYPYTKSIMFEKTTNGSKFTAVKPDSLLSISSGWLYCPHESLDDFMYYAKTDEFKQTSESDMASVYTAASTILAVKIRYMLNLKSFLEYYTNPNDKEMIDYWKICLQTRVPYNGL